MTALHPSVTAHIWFDSHLTCWLLASLDWFGLPCHLQHSDVVQHLRLLQGHLLSCQHDMDAGGTPATLLVGRAGTGMPALQPANLILQPHCEMHMLVVSRLRWLYRPTSMPTLPLQHRRRVRRCALNRQGCRLSPMQEQPQAALLKLSSWARCSRTLRCNGQLVARNAVNSLPEAWTQATADHVCKARAHQSGDLQPAGLPACCVSSLLMQSKACVCMIGCRRWPVDLAVSQTPFCKQWPHRNLGVA